LSINIFIKTIFTSASGWPLLGAPAVFTSLASGPISPAAGNKSFFPVPGKARLRPGAQRWGRPHR